MCCFFFTLRSCGCACFAGRVSFFDPVEHGGCGLSVVFSVCLLAPMLFFFHSSSAGLGCCCFLFVCFFWYCFCSAIVLVLVAALNVFLFCGVLFVLIAFLFAARVSLSFFRVVWLLFSMCCFFLSVSWGIVCDLCVLAHGMCFACCISADAFVFGAGVAVLCSLLLGSTVDVVRVVLILLACFPRRVFFLLFLCWAWLHWMLSAFYVVVCFFVCASCSFDFATPIFFCLQTRFISVSSCPLRGCRVCALICSWRRRVRLPCGRTARGGFALLIFVTWFFPSPWRTSSVVIRGRVYELMSERAFRRLALVGLFFFYSFFWVWLLPFCCFLCLTSFCGFLFVLLVLFLHGVCFFSVPFICFLCRFL